MAISISAIGLHSNPDSVGLMTLSQTSDAPFLTGPSSVGPQVSPRITLTGTTTFSEAGTYRIIWTLSQLANPSATIVDTTILVVGNLLPPPGVQAYYVPTPSQVPINNGTGILTLVVWDGTVPESDPLAWNGWRVRRTIHGISPTPFEVAGQYADVIITTDGPEHVPVSSLCLAQFAPCNPDSFQFTGNGVFFKGFQNNSLGNGRYIIDYPPGNPVDQCSSCWVFADLAGLAGFRTDYTVTTIGPFDQSDYIETPLSASPVVTITPGTAPAANLERVAVVPNPYKGSAQWDPAVGEGRIHFIHLPHGSTVRIFTTSAELIRELTLNSAGSPGGTVGELEWDLRNGQGRKVVSGIYLYQVETPEGRTRKGHFVIIK